MESRTKLLKANDFVASKVVMYSDFYNGVNNARLLHIPLTNSCTTKDKYKARGNKDKARG